MHSQLAHFEFSAALSITSSFFSSLNCREWTEEGAGKEKVGPARANFPCQGISSFFPLNGPEQIKVSCPEFLLSE